MLEARTFTATIIFCEDTKNVETKAYLGCYESMRKALLHHVVHSNKRAVQWLVFLHGAGGSTATWKYQTEVFKPYFNILLIDLRDHGLSKNIDPESEHYNFDLITEDLKKVLDQNGVSKAHFITLSFGSVIMQDLSIKYPYLVASAVFAGGIFKANILIRCFVQMARLFNFIFPYKWMYSIFSYLLMPYKKHRRSRSIYKKQAQKLCSEEYMRWVGLYNEFFHLLERFYHQQIDFPALTIMGKEDYIFLNAAKKFAQAHESVHFKEIEQAGHICNIDQPTAFNKLALCFIRESQGILREDLPADQTQKTKAG